MAIEFFLIAIAVVLSGGLVAGLALAYREIEARRAAEASTRETTRPAPGLYTSNPADEAVAQELMVRQLEHYLRREAMAAQQFVDNPTPQTLRAGAQQPLGRC